MSSRRFADYIAYKRLFTYDPDGWGAAVRVAQSVVDGELVKRFLPIDDVGAQDRIDRDAENAELQMDNEL